MRIAVTFYISCKFLICVKKRFPKVEYFSHSATLFFSTQTKSSEDKNSVGTCYDVNEVRISQEKHLSLGFSLSYQQNSASQAALVGKLASTG